MIVYAQTYTFFAILGSGRIEVDDTHEPRLLVKDLIASI
jgi:hypothetical protein